jgi:hypothetical protein
MTLWTALALVGFAGLVLLRASARLCRGSRARAAPRPILIAPPCGCGPEGLRTAWKEVPGLTKEQAEDLLDWLENNCAGRREVDDPTPAGFRLRFR